MLFKKSSQQPNDSDLRQTEVLAASVGSMMQDYYTVSDLEPAEKAADNVESEPNEGAYSETDSCIHVKQQANDSKTDKDTANKSELKDTVGDSHSLISLRHISKVYKMGDEELRANDDISLDIGRGEFVAIVGKSGSGKSTLMNIIGALDVPSEGNYFLDGRDTSTMNDNELAEIRNHKLGFIFQQYNLLPKLSILENVELPLLYQGMKESQRKEKAMAELERVGLKDKAYNKPKQLSGGQQQRVSIARALAGNPSIILADEPTGALDSKTGREVLGFLKQLNTEGNTIIMITHDPTLAVQAKRVVQIMDGRITFDGSAEEYGKL